MLQSKSHGFSLLTSSPSAWFRSGGSSRLPFTRLKLFRRGTDRDTASSRRDAEAESSGQGKRRMPKVPHLPLDRLRRPYSPLRLRRTAALTSTSDDEADEEDSCSMVYRSDESLPMTLSVSTEENNFPTMDTDHLLLDCNCCTDQLDRQTCHYFFPTTGGANGLGTPLSGRETAATLEAFPLCTVAKPFPAVTSYCTPMKASIEAFDSLSSTDSPSLVCVSRRRRPDSLVDEDDARTISFNFTSVLTPSLTQRSCGGGGGKADKSDRLFSRLPLQSAAGLFSTQEQAAVDGSRVSTTCTSSSFSYGGGCCAVGPEGIMHVGSAGGGGGCVTEALVSYFSIQTSGSHSARFCTARGEEVLPTFQRCRSTIKADDGILPTSEETTTLLLTLNKDVRSLSHSKKKKLPHFLPHCRNKSAMPILRRHRRHDDCRRPPVPLRRRSSRSAGPPSFVVLLTARRRQYKLRRKQEKRIRRRLRRRELYGKYVRRHRGRAAAATVPTGGQVAALDLAQQFPSRIPIGETLELDDEPLCAPLCSADNEEDDEDIIAENVPDNWPQVAEDDSYYFPKTTTRRAASRTVKNSSLEQWVIETIELPSCLDHKMVTTSPSAMDSARPHYCRDSFRGLLKLVVKRRRPRPNPS